ncbi:MAG: DNA cytosine methyltransferase [Rhodobacteraceae bacterium]|nr:DNA cytosine methyltransferase [Paracoccaceae bacterium]
MSPLSAGGEENEAVPNHAASNLSALNLKRIKATEEGGGHRNWPEQLKLERHKSLSGHADAYGRMAWNAPASGLTTRCISYPNGRFGHPEQNRAVGVREAACLQTFPESFIFKGVIASMARQIGNAAPVMLAERIGERFKEHLNGVGSLS